MHAACHQTVLSTILAPARAGGPVKGSGPRIRNYHRVVLTYRLAEQEDVARRNAWVRHYIKLGEYDRAVELGWDRDSGLIVADDLTRDPEVEMPQAA